MPHCTHRQMAAGLMALVLAVLFAEVWVLIESRNAAMTAQRLLTPRKNEWMRLSALDPAPTAAQSAQIDDELAKSEENLAALWATLEAVGHRSVRPDGTAGFSEVQREAGPDVAELIRGLREQARQAAVSVRPEETFGFAAIGADRPPPEPAGLSQRELEATDFVIRTLFAARPTKFVAARRVRMHSPASRSPRKRKKEAEDPGDAGETLELDSRLSVREPGLIEASALRLTFTGCTITLRQFLNRLLDGDHLVAINEVAVEPAEAARDAPREKHAGSEAVALLVPDGLSRFTVTVECCELAAGSGAAREKSPAAGARTAGAAGSAAWPEPAVQTRGRGWVYEVFTPPAVFYDRQTRALAAVPAANVLPADPDAPPAELQLLQVRPGVFRYQLVGYAGKRDNPHGVFADTVTGETVLGRAGEHVGRDRFLLEKLRVGRAGGEEGGNPAPGGLVATATVLDETTGDEVVLTTLGRSLAGAPQGLFASLKKPDWRCELREGEAIACNGLSYRVDRLELDPPLAVVECPAEDGSRGVSRILLPVASPTVAAAGPAGPATKHTVRTASGAP